jgi:Lon protease-like protein
MRSFGHDATQTRSSPGAATLGMEHILEILPLFPLHTVLFPEGPLKLRIFEPRYLDMIGRCMREGSVFGVALIVQGFEAGGPARTARVGTTARIVDFEKLPDGLLGISAVGERRFSIIGSERQPDGLNIGQVEWLPADAPAAIPPECSILADMLRQAFPQVNAAYGAMTPRYEDASWVSMRLTELLPLQPAERQQCLEMSDALERLKLIRDRLDVRE